MDKTMMSISVCIPTCNRPGLLQEAIQSCLEQTRLPDEILIGDDSPAGGTEQLVNQLRANAPVTIRYDRNRPSRGQGNNINGLYQRVTTSHLVLLHDDDLLLPDSLELLSGCWKEYPDLDAAYGKQHVISQQGVLDEGESEVLNRAYFRTADFAGLQRNSWLAGIVQQFPNDAFMARTEAARATPWLPQDDVGYAGEYEFSLRFCMKWKKLFFLDHYTAKYRVSADSMSLDPGCDVMLQTFRILKNAILPPEAEKARKTRLCQEAPLAISQAALLGKRAEALQIFFGEYHPWGSRLSMGGIWRLSQCLFPARAIQAIRRFAGEWNGPSMRNDPREQFKT